MPYKRRWFVHVCVRVCMFVCVCVRVCICACVCACMWKDAVSLMCVSTLNVWIASELQPYSLHTHLCVCVCVCVCLCVSVCMCISPHLITRYCMGSQTRYTQIRIQLWLCPWCRMFLSMIPMPEANRIRIKYWEGLWYMGSPAHGFMGPSVHGARESDVYLGLGFHLGGHNPINLPHRIFPMTWFMLYKMRLFVHVCACVYLCLCVCMHVKRHCQSYVCVHTQCMNCFRVAAILIAYTFVCLCMCERVHVPIPPPYNPILHGITN